MVVVKGVAHDAVEDRADAAPGVLLDAARAGMGHADSGDAVAGFALGREVLESEGGAASSTFERQRSMICCQDSGITWTSYEISRVKQTTSSPGRIEIRSPME